MACSSCGSNTPKINSMSTKNIKTMTGNVVKATTTKIGGIKYTITPKI